MKIKSIIPCLSLLIISPSFFCAPVSSNGISDEMRKHLESENLPIPNSGIKVVKQNEIKYLSNNDLKIKSQAKYEIKKNGYYKDTQDTRATELLNLKNISTQFSEYKQSPEEIKLSFPFSGIKSDNITKIIGYVPEGTFKKGLGWSGIGVDFDTTFGSCAYTRSNMRLTGMSATFSENDITYDINNKVTLISSYGSEKTNYLYRLMWFDDNFYHELECASQSYSNATKEEITKLARTLDKK